MAGNIDLKPGSDARHGTITEEEGCCPCCGGPCYDNCDLCDREEGIHSVQAEPSCCTGRCCTCFPGSKIIIENLNEEGGTPPIWLSTAELEASFYLEDCLYDTPSGESSNGKCVGYLGSITLCPSRTIGPAKDASGNEIAGGLDALCIRKTDPPRTTFTDGAQDCRFQICGQKTRDGLPEQQSNTTHGIPIYEIWCGAGRICFDDQEPQGTQGGTSEDFPADGCEWKVPPHEDCTKPQDKKDTGTCGYEQDTTATVPVGQFIEMSICCCQGNNYDDGDCHRGFPHYNCEQIKKDITGTGDGPAETGAEVDIDQVCSCACYSVEFKFHDPSEYPFIKSEAGGDKCYLTGKSGSDPCYVGGFSGGDHSNQPGCAGDDACSMDITDCRCMDTKGVPSPTPLQPEHADGWYICAEYTGIDVITCACCPGMPDLPGGGGGGGGGGSILRGGCKSGYKIRAFITVKDQSSARHNPRVPDQCPSC